MQLSRIIAPTFQQQSPARQKLIRLMQRINFGELRHLSIQNGDPVLDPPPTTIRAVKFAGDDGPRAEMNQSDFALKEQMLRFLSEIDALCDGEFELVKIQAGLPSVAMIHG